uniref:Uncharacterized protein n=1 Tax=Physcomitrium patens TaxID=3218 RepID=A0A2K1J213_PHYPA|nr:hypothetical protein PHYPA_023461 [Physcomitrium patens]
MTPDPIQRSRKACKGWSIFWANLLNRI